jgi:hypothetical protein
VTGYRLDDRGSIPYRFFILTWSALGSTQPYIQWVPARGAWAQGAVLSRISLQFNHDDKVHQAYTIFLTNEVVVHLSGTDTWNFPQIAYVS